MTLPNGYEMQTTFFMDFRIAEEFGIDAVKDTFENAFKNWKTNYIYLTELAIVMSNKELDRQLEKIMKGDNMDYENLDDTQIYTIIHDDVETINIDKDYEHRGGKYLEIIFKDTTIYKYHLLKYGNYDRIYIIDNDKETRLEDITIKKRFLRK